MVSCLRDVGYRMLPNTPVICDQPHMLHRCPSTPPYLPYHDYYLVLA